MANVMVMVVSEERKEGRKEKGRLNKSKQKKKKKKNPEKLKKKNMYPTVVWKTTS